MVKQISDENINIADVTRQILDLVMKLPGSEKIALLKQIAPEARIETGENAPANTTTQLIDRIMKQGIQERCRILGELMAMSGSSRRKYSRIDFFSPIEYVISGHLNTGFIRNISVTGIFIEARHYSGPELKPGMSIMMTFNHPHTGAHTKIQGKIVRITRGGIGIRFDEII